ncbi:MAG: YraN family protein [Crocinitomicaceae bacterium]|nr:YraN family protein [Crocinitomicaceae bacterium]
MNHIELGKVGEDYAANYLSRKGFQIVDRNYRFGKLEIDIICTHENKLVFIEVKTRNSIALGSPYLSVTPHKQRQIIKVSNRYIIENNRTEEVRFDIVSIIYNSKKQELEHIVDAFYPIA